MACIDGICNSRRFSVCQCSKSMPVCNFRTKSIQKIDFTDPELESIISKEEPVIITNSNIVETALKWSPEYLQKNIGPSNFNVFVSDTEYFKYFDEKKLSLLPGFSCPNSRQQITFDSFMKKCASKDGKRYYLQQPLHNGVGENIVADFVGFNWPWLSKQQSANKWGPLTSNLLLCSMPGNVTPCHYDEQNNFFSQLYGRKRVLLFHPQYYQNLYPYPCFHPHDRQSMVNVDDPDYERFPLAKDIDGLQGIVEPGDVLYIPIYWWHYIESVPDEGMTTSVTFWYKGGSLTEKLQHPFSARQKVAIRRNIEKMLCEALVDPQEVTQMMREIVIGRYTEGSAWLPDLGSAEGNRLRALSGPVAGSSGSCEAGKSEDSSKKNPSECEEEQSKEAVKD